MDFFFNSLLNFFHHGHCLLQFSTPPFFVYLCRSLFFFQSSSVSPRSMASYISGTCQSDASDNPTFRTCVFARSGQHRTHDSQQSDHLIQGKTVTVTGSFCTLVYHQNLSSFCHIVVWNHQYYTWVCVDALRWGTMGAEMKVLDVEAPELTKVLPFKSRVGQNIALDASPANRMSAVRAYKGCSF